MMRTWVVILAILVAGSKAGFKLPLPIPLPNIPFTGGDGTDSGSSSGSSVKDTPISGDTNRELFQHFRCQLCKDLARDNIEFADGEAKLNENFQIGYLVCNTLIKRKLDSFLNSFLTNHNADTLSRIICSRIHMCTD
ncbi:unnamed protein product [Caenorhabditis auriculariae]|uniref:Saposin B-type domain-containing protein n=1 Tax=Caenorhabditis auriculariae TaxID=2777116 RepID=A0A8S1HIT7_9PELO|nr:unnamed protein product [Caenorhabditis auriculariae]